MQPFTRTNESIPSSPRRPWEQEASFHDVLYDWMDRAPWLAISAAAHVLALFIVAALIGERRPEPPAKAINTSMIQAPEELLDEPEPEVIEPIEMVEEPIDEPVIRDVEVAKTNQTNDDQTFDSPLGDDGLDNNDPFSADATNDVTGLGGGAGGGGGGGGFIDSAPGSPQLERAVGDAFKWLRAHQSDDGSWDADGFDAECGKVGDTLCSGTGKPQHDVGVTGLALLAYMGAGNTMNAGEYKAEVRAGVNWLRSMQDPDSGLIGDKSNHEFLYDHAIATLALCEATASTPSPFMKRTAQDAVNYIQRARNYGSAWRYSEPGNGQNDTSVTGWMVFALKAAEGAGLMIDRDAYAGATSWFDEVTDRTNGRVGYNERGSRSSRITGVNDEYPAEVGEGMTAVALLSRIFMGERPDDNPLLEQHADLLLTALPEWDPDGLANDMYYWYYGTYAMFQMGGKHWRKWEATILPELVATQSSRGDEKGSWEPNGPWGHAGGRVYSTALMALSIQVYYRYPNLTGTR